MTRLRSILEQALLALPLVAAAVALVHFESLWKWDQVLYDFALQRWQRPAPDDIVIVAIDQKSLSRLGRWPWPRRTHAALLDRLNAYNSGPAALDVIFAERDPTDPQGDLQLAAAAERHGQVVLPVVFEQAADSGLFEELLPYPALDQTVQIGHADMELDLDGIARSLYLKAGIDDPYWPALALRLLELRDPGALGELPGLTRPTPAAPPTPRTRLVRDHRVWIAFAGPPGHFHRLSYIDVLSDDAAAARLRGKTVLIGFTAIGQDVLPTPVSGERNPMPGVEIHANALDTLARGLWVRPLDAPWIYALTLVCALLPLLVYPRLSPRWAAPAALVFFALPLLGSLALLIGAQLWFPPAAAMLSVILGYLLWSGRRLQTTLRYLDQELERLTQEPAALPRRPRAPQLEPLLEFIRHALPIEGCVLCAPDGSIRQRWGAPIDAAPLPAGDQGWRRAGEVWWIDLPARRKRWRLGVRWGRDGTLNDAEQALLDEIMAPYLHDRSARPVTAIEVLQERIQQVQRAGSRLRAMRVFINNSMAQMADGMLVTDGFGRVLLGNPKAALYLNDDADAALVGQSLPELFDRLEFIGPSTWRQALGDVLVGQHLAQLPARSRAGHDLLIHMAPFSDSQHGDEPGLDLGRGLIVNFADVSALRASERRRAEMLSFLSHDLRSPLASVIALTQLARYKPEQLTDGTIVDQIEERTEAILGLVDDFLQLARAESSDEIDLAEVDLVPLAEEALEQVAPLAESRSSTVVDEIDCDEAWLLGNGSLLRRLFVNLLSNALKYSPDRSRIRLGVEHADGEIRCWVADDGYGIAAEHLPTLFDRFQRIHRKEHKKEHGSGLGLAFVKSVVDRHHARIDVVSELNRGTTFTLYFPLLALAADARDARTAVAQSV